MNEGEEEEGRGAVRNGKTGRSKVRSSRRERR